MVTLNDEAPGDQIDHAEAEETAFAHWAILELMGHRRVYGKVREVAVFGTTMLRIDSPVEPPITQFYAPSAIYCVTPTTEEVVRKACAPHPAARISFYADGDDAADDIGF